MSRRTPSPGAGPRLASGIGLALALFCAPACNDADGPETPARAPVEAAPAVDEASPDGPAGSGAAAEDAPAPHLPPDLPPPKVIDPNGDELGAFEPGGSVAAVLREAGLGPRVRQQILEALTVHTDPARVRPGQRYVITREHDEVVAFALVLSTTRRVTARKRYDDSQHATWTGELSELETESELVRYSGEVRGSLWASVERAGADPTLVAIFIDAFAYDIDFHTDTRAGDRFALVVERHELDGQFVRYGRVHAARYTGHVGEFELFWWPDPKKKKRDPEAGDYFDGHGRGIRKTFLKSPLKFSRVSSAFNPKRMHPVLHREKGHMGTDYAAPEGTPVWAAADGKIIVRADKGGSGNMVILRHANGLKTLYMHLSKFEPGQRVGTRVKQKDVIGYVGSTGLATGPHLHFGVQKGGKYVDPESVEVHRSEDLPKAQRQAFFKHIRELREQLDAGEPPADTAEPESEADSNSEAEAEPETEP